MAEGVDIARLGDFHEGLSGSALGGGRGGRKRREKDEIRVRAFFFVFCFPFALPCFAAIADSKTKKGPPHLPVARRAPARHVSFPQQLHDDLAHRPVVLDGFGRGV